MAQIILKTDMPNQAAKFLVEALETEKLRLKYTMKLAKRRLSRFEKKYSVTSKQFMEEWSAEDLKGKDIEYVEWAGEYNLTKVQLVKNIPQILCREGRPLCADPDGGWRSRTSEPRRLQTEDIQLKSQ